MPNHHPETPAGRGRVTIPAIRKLARAKGFDFAGHEDRKSPLGTKLDCCIFEPGNALMPLLEFQVWGSSRSVRNRRAINIVRALKPRALHLEAANAAR